MNWRLAHSTDRPRLAIFVSKYDHCLVDLLYRQRNGELACEIPLIISNHADAQRHADFYRAVCNRVLEVPFDLLNCLNQSVGTFGRGCVCVFSI